MSFVEERRYLYRCDRCSRTHEGLTTTAFDEAAQDMEVHARGWTRLTRAILDGLGDVDEDMTPHLGLHLCKDCASGFDRWLADANRVPAPAETPSG